jgi:hypothetical protein
MTSTSWRWIALCLPRSRGYWYRLTRGSIPENRRVVKHVTENDEPRTEEVPSAAGASAPFAGSVFPVGRHFSLDGYRHHYCLGLLRHR